MVVSVVVVRNTHTFWDSDVMKEKKKTQVAGFQYWQEWELRKKTKGEKTGIRKKKRMMMMRRRNKKNKNKSRRRGNRLL